MSKSCALPKSYFPVKFKVRSPVEALKLARGLIRPFKHWTTGRLGVKTEVETYDMGDGEMETETSEVELDECDIKDPKAEAFCALGALLRVNTKHQDAAKEFLEQAAATILRHAKEDAIEDDIFDVNDGTGDRKNHKKVLQMFTKAIHLAKRAAKKRKKSH